MMIVEGKIRATSIECPNGFRPVMSLGVTAIIVTVLIGCLSGPESNPATLERWNGSDRGRVLCAFRDSSVPGGHVLGVLHLPSRELRMISLGDRSPSFVTFDTPRWGEAGGRFLYFSAYRRELLGGVFLLDTTDMSFDLFFPSGRWRHKGAADTSVIVEEGRLKVHYDPPGVTVTDLGFDFCPQTSSFFILQRYDINAGPPGWQFSPDSTDLPEKLRSRVREMHAIGVERWSDLIQVDSLGNITLIAELGDAKIQTLVVSNTGRYIAMSDLDHVRIFDMVEEKMLVPALPEGVTAAFASAFSPNDSILVTCAIRGRHTNDILMTCYAPSFEVFEPYVTLNSTRPDYIDWSPDGEWLLIRRFVLYLSRPRGTELIALEVSTGEQFEIEWPYLINGEPQPQYRIATGVDWVE